MPQARAVNVPTYLRTPIVTKNHLYMDPYVAVSVFVCALRYVHVFSNPERLCLNVVTFCRAFYCSGCVLLFNNRGWYHSLYRMS